MVRTLLDGELSKTSEFGRTLDKHLLKLAPLVPALHISSNICLVLSSRFALDAAEIKWRSCIWHCVIPRSSLAFLPIVPLHFWRPFAILRMLHVGFLDIYLGMMSIVRLVGTAHFLSIIDLIKDVPVSWYPFRTLQTLYPHFGPF